MTKSPTKVMTRRTPTNATPEATMEAIANRIKIAMTRMTLTAMMWADNRKVDKMTLRDKTKDNVPSPLISVPFTQT